MQKQKENMHKTVFALQSFNIYYTVYLGNNNVLHKNSPNVPATTVTYIQWPIKKRI